jgi:hypothetical protein
MIIIGADYHPGFQQIAFVDTAQQRDTATLVSSFSLSKVAPAPTRRLSSYPGDS